MLHKGPSVGQGEENMPYSSEMSAYPLSMTPSAGQMSQMPYAPYPFPPQMLPPFNGPPQPMPQMTPQMANVFANQQFAALASGMTLGEYPSFDAASPSTDRSDYDFIPKLKEDIRKNEYDQVSGRLCLLSATKKYKITVGEIYRRISQPETLHASLVNSILRNAKAKDNGHKLRTNLMNFNIELPQGRRKTCKTTCFTALCEGEAHQLGEDFTQLMLTRGGAAELGKTYVTRLMELGKNLHQIRMELDIISDFMKFMTEIHPENREPDDLLDDTPIQKVVSTLSLLTHGFSHVAINGVAKYMREIASSQILEPFESAENQRNVRCQDVPRGFFPHPNASEQ